MERPNATLASGAELVDLSGAGRPDVVVLRGSRAGVYPHAAEESGWEPFHAFSSPLLRDFADPNLRFIDLDGDGIADVLITEGDSLVWHPSRHQDGFGKGQRIAAPWDEARGPRLVFADPRNAIFLADMNGDGLADLVRVGHAEVCWWPNLGYGHFGACVVMDDSPWLDDPKQFDPKRVRLADIDGSGPADLLYLGTEGARGYFNEGGDRWTRGQVLADLPAVDDLSWIGVADLLGNGTACLVWSCAGPGESGRNLRYAPLSGPTKPHLLASVVNSLGAEVRIHHAPSTRFLRQDEADGRPWVTRLPFPVHVVGRIETLDLLSGQRFVTRYAYHHGHYDEAEREFRGVV